MNLRQTASNGMCALAVLIITAGYGGHPGGARNVQGHCDGQDSIRGDDNGSGHDYGRPEDV